MSAAEIEDVAAGWLIRREEPGWTDQDEAEFAAWMERSMAHKAAYWRLERPIAFPHWATRRLALRKRRLRAAAGRSSRLSAHWPPRSFWR